MLVPHMTYSTSSVLHKLAFCPACHVMLPLLGRLPQADITTCHLFTLQDEGIRFGNLKPSKTGLSYEDLLGVPCVLILCEKGRMGDTLPHTPLQFAEHVCCSLQKYSGEGSLEPKLPDSSRFTEIYSAIQAWRQNSSADLTQVGHGLQDVFCSHCRHCSPEINQFIKVHGLHVCDAKLEMPCMHECLWSFTSTIHSYCCR